jgi:hypothetical protein
MSGATKTKKFPDLRAVPKVTVPVRASLREDLDGSIAAIRGLLVSTIADLSMHAHDFRYGGVVDADELESLRDDVVAALYELRGLEWHAKEVGERASEAAE